MVKFTLSRPSGAPQARLRTALILSKPEKLMYTRIHPGCDQELDEDAAKEEEEEALRLQKLAAEQLQPEDYELSGASSSDADEDEEADTLEAQALQVQSQPDRKQIIMGTFWDGAAP